MHLQAMGSASAPLSCQPISNSSTPVLPRIQRICILGCGTSGLATLKHLLPFHNKDQFHTIHIYERRSAYGGIWNYTKEIRELGEDSVPLTDPWSEGAAREEEPITVPTNGNMLDSDGDSTVNATRTFVSAIYDTLEANIPSALMAFKDHPFPEGTALYPPHTEVLEYIKSYGQSIPNLNDHLFLNRNVRSVRKEEGSDEWIVQVENVITGEMEEERRYDAVIICTGNYSVPFIPEIPGLKEWARDGHFVEHSRNFRRADEERWKGKKIIVVGNAASAFDCSYQLATSGSIKLPLIQSIRTTIPLPKIGLLGPDILRKVPEISSFTKNPLTDTWLVNFKDGSFETGVSGVLFCTGYMHTIPYLHLPQSLENIYPVISHIDPQCGFRLRNLYHHFLYIPDPTLAFIAISFKNVPTTIAEAQSSVLARIYAGLIPLLCPADHTSFLSRKNGKDKESEVIKEIMFNHLSQLESRPDISRDAWKQFHCIDYPVDAEYISMFGEWCSQQSEKQLIRGEETTIPRDWPIWGTRERWLRKNVKKIKTAFIIKEIKNGVKATRIEELGFAFEKETESAAGLEEGKEVGTVNEILNK